MYVYGVRELRKCVTVCRKPEIVKTNKFNGVVHFSVDGPEETNKNANHGVEDDQLVQLEDSTERQEHIQGL